MQLPNVALSRKSIVNTQSIDLEPAGFPRLPDQILLFDLLGELLHSLEPGAATAPLLCIDGGGAETTGLYEANFVGWF